MYQTIRQSVKFSASPHEVYEVLMDSEKHSAFSGSEATLSREVGGEFSTHSGHIGGYTLELSPDKRIVLAWRPHSWAEGHYSTATFELEAVDQGTQINFTQTGVPADVIDDIDKGWHENYWEKMEAYLKE